MPTLQQLAASLNPNDSSALNAMTGGGIASNQANNQYGVGGTSYKPWLTALASNGLTEPKPGAMAQQWAAEGLGTVGPDGKWQWAPGKGWDASDAANTGWSGVNASGGFAGGTGTGINESQGVKVGADGTYSNVQQLAQGSGAGGGLAGAMSTAAAGGGVGYNPGATKPDPMKPAGAYGAPVTGGIGGGIGGIANGSIAGPGAMTGNGANSFSGAPVGGGVGGAASVGAAGGAAGGAGTGTGSGTGSGTSISEAMNARYKVPEYTAPEGTTVSPGNPMDFFNDEGYKFRLAEGKKAIENSAAARGNMLSGATLKGLENFASGLASDEYGAAYNRYGDTRDYNTNVFRDARDTGRANFESDRGFGFDAFRDERNFGEDTRRNNRDFDESGRRYEKDFGENTRRWDLGFDFDVEKDSRNFNESTRRYDQGFNYTAATGDRNFNATTLQNLASMGLQGSGGDASLAAQLAALLSNNTMTGAGAGANGTVGNANNTNAFMSQLLKMLTGNAAINSTNP